MIALLLLYLADLCVFTPGYVSSKYDHSPRKKKLIKKGICICIPLLVLLAGTVYRTVIYGPDIYLFILLAGMILCAVGDIILEIRFIKGGFLFFGGHLLYVCGALYHVRSFRGETLIIFLALAGIGTFLTFDRLDRKYRGLLIAYNIMISASFAMGTALYSTYLPGNVLPGLGFMFLVVSDWLLARNKMAGSTFGWSLVSLLFYFGGQILISTVVFF